VSLLRVGERGKQRLVLDPQPCRDDGAAAIDQDSPHLAGPGLSIRKELQTLLAINDVKAVIDQLERCSVTLHELDRPTPGFGEVLGHFDHQWIHIHTNDPTLRSHQYGRLTRDDPRAARNIKHPFSGARRRQSEDLSSEGFEEGWYEVLQISNRGIRRVRHQPSSNERGPSACPALVWKSRADDSIDPSTKP
jgi:hypothetical protein